MGLDFSPGYKSGIKGGALVLSASTKHSEIKMASIRSNPQRIPSSMSKL